MKRKNKTQKKINKNFLKNNTRRYLKRGGYPYTSWSVTAAAAAAHARAAAETATAHARAAAATATARAAAVTATARVAAATAHARLLEYLETMKKSLETNQEYMKRFCNEIKTNANKYYGPIISDIKTEIHKINNENVSLTGEEQIMKNLIYNPTQNTIESALALLRTKIENFPWPPLVFVSPLQLKKQTGGSPILFGSPMLLPLIVMFGLFFTNPLIIGSIYILYNICQPLFKWIVNGGGRKYSKRQIMKKKRKSKKRKYNKYNKYK